MEQQHTRVPALRFPEFEGDWVEKRLGEVTTWASGGTPPKDNSDYWNGDIPWISASSMRGLEYSDSDLKITVEGLKKGSKLAKRDSLLILVRGSMLFNKIPIGIATRDVSFNQDVKSITVNDSSTSKYILYWFIASETKLLNMVTGTGIGAGKLDLEDLKTLEISLPTLPEQQKIATFFTAIDEKLRGLKEKQSLLEVYKKGVMQQLFTQQIRFKKADGGDFEDWTVRRLGEVGETYGGLNGKTKENFGKGKPYIQYKQVFDDSKIDISRFELVDIEENESQNKVQFGDVFFTISSETPNEIGMSSVLLDEVEDLYLNSFCFGFRANSLKELSPYFSRYLFRSETLRNQIIKLAQGSTRYNMSKLQLMKIEVSLPTLPEQTQIATYLSALDAKIAAVSAQVSALGEWKKGLLQRMFP